MTDSISKAGQASAQQTSELLTIRVAALKAVLKAELSVLFSQFGHDQGPAEYEVDYIVGCIAERGTLAPGHHHAGPKDTP